MGLAIFATAIEAVRAATESLGLHCEVTHTTYPDGYDAQGAPIGDSVETIRTGQLVRGEKYLDTPQGRKLLYRAVLTLFPYIEGEVAIPEGLHEPPPAVLRGDTFPLPGGDVMRVVDIPDAPVDPETGDVLLRVVWLA